MKKVFSYNTILGTITIAENKGCITDITLSRKIRDAETEETPVIKEAYEQLQQYFEGKRKNFHLPLSPEGTVFQRKVWRGLCSIPYGETKTYKEIAQYTGNVKACRAIGMANNKNPIMIVIPCHRVVGSDGSLTGYACGLEIKRKLLELEKNNV